MGSILADLGQCKCKRPLTRPSLRPAETAPCRGRAAYNGIDPEIQEMQGRYYLVRTSRSRLPPPLWGRDGERGIVDSADLLPPSRLARRIRPPPPAGGQPERGAIPRA